LRCAPVLFYFSYFSGWILHFFPGWPRSVILPPQASYVTETSGTCHHS
jgi:hypothetical protein